MKRFFTSVGLILVHFWAQAQVPQTISYQGLLTDANGSPLTGTHSVIFSFYTTTTGGTATYTRGPLTVQTYQGLFTVILGNGVGTNNTPIPNLGSTQYYIGVTPDNQAELSPRVTLTAVPYAFTASALDVNATIQGSQVTGALTNATIDASKVNAGTLASSQIGAGSIDNTKLASGIDATKVTVNAVALTNGGTGATTAANARTNLGVAIGTNVQAYDADLDDLADGSLTGSKVGTGINAANVSTGTLPLSVIPTGIDPLKIASTPAFNAFKNSGTVANGGLNVVIDAWTTTNYNYSSSFNATTGVFTAPSNGVYTFNAMVSFSTLITPSSYVAFFTYTDTGTGNSTSLVMARASGDVSASVGSCTYYMKAGDTMKLNVYQGSGGTISYHATPGWTHFSGVKIGN